MTLRRWTGRPGAEAKVSLDSFDRSDPCASEDTPKGTWIGIPLVVLARVESQTIGGYWFLGESTALRIRNSPGGS